MVIAENLNAETWSMFLRFANVILQFNWEEIRFIKDQEKGAHIAISVHLPGAKQLHCTMHQKTNVYKQCYTGTGPEFVSAVNTYTEADNLRMREKYIAKGRFYMEKVADNKQYPIKFGFMYGKALRKGAKVTINALKNVHETPSSAAFIWALKDNKPRYNKARLDSESLED